ncbi:hypothetical protein M8J77_020442 [Diaphorina citri]|nr:hypothetical protein M8J77_020442 [Diaphorina citri]
MEIAASQSDAYQEENRNMILDMRSSLESNLERAKLEMREEIGTVRSEFQHGVSNVQSEVDDIRESLIKTNNEIQVLKETLNNPSSPPVTNNTRNLPLIVESSSRAFQNSPSISSPLISSPAVHKMRSPEFDGTLGPRGTVDQSVRGDGQICIVKWFDNKPVLLVSSKEGMNPLDECDVIRRLKDIIFKFQEP